jgi:hypothetical protein
MERVIPVEWQVKHAPAVRQAGGRMAIYAARMGKYFADLGKHCARARVAIRNSFKRRGRPQLV